MSVDGELRFAVEDHEHLLAAIVEVLADAAMGVDDALMDEDEVGAERIRTQQGSEFHGASAAMHVLYMLEILRAQNGLTRWASGRAWWPSAQLRRRSLQATPSKGSHCR